MRTISLVVIALFVSGNLMADESVWKSEQLVLAPGTVRPGLAPISGIKGKPDTLEIENTTLLTQAEGVDRTILKKVQCFQDRIELNYKDYEQAEYRKACYLRAFKTEDGIVLDYLLRVLVNPAGAVNSFTIVGLGTMKVSNSGEWYVLSEDQYTIKDDVLRAIGKEGFWDMGYDLSDINDLMDILGAQNDKLLVEMIESDRWDGILNNILVAPGTAVKAKGSDIVSPRSQSLL